MGRKKRRDEAKDAVQPFCYYCDREFDNENVLIQHQKSKHFKCHACGKKMTTVGALITHFKHVHKEAIKKVPNAKEGRDGLALQVYGMEGVPPEMLHDAPATKRQRVHGNEDGSDDEEDGGAGAFH
jgi:hypothetical protein